MATDATGTPTAVLGIPKYDTSVDAPSGLGFNAAMDVLDTLITAANKTVFKHAGATIGTRRALNLIEGSNVTLTVVDDAANDKVDVTVAAASSGGAVSGDLSGSVPGALTVVANAITSGKVADGAITSAKIADGTIVDADISSSAGITVPKLSVKYARGSVTGVGVQNVSFGMTFASAPVVVVSSDIAGFPAGVQAGSIGTTGCQVFHQSGSSGTIYWVAVGV